MGQEQGKGKDKTGENSAEQPRARWSQDTGRSRGSSRDRKWEMAGQRANAKGNDCQLTITYTVYATNS